MLNDILILGAGSAGLIAALTLKRRMPHLSVRVVRSPEIAVIGVGEATTPNMPNHLFNYLGISRKRFYALASPTWKMGIHFIWGPRPSFEYAFEPQLDVRSPELPRPNGYYCDDDFSFMNLNSSLMSLHKAFPRQANGAPDIPAWHAFHLENPKLVKALEIFAREDGVQITDGKMKAVERGPQGIAAIVLEDGQRLAADFFIDASGFRSELLGKALEEPFISFGSSLFNDRALVGSWQRGPDEPILPYTTAETMDAGWCWRIEHEHTINRGYVYSSSLTTDDQAREEFVRKNPRVVADNLHVVKFRSGRYRRGWAENVMAVGNSGGFVEPLESSALMVVCWQCQTFADMVQLVGPTPGIRDLFNNVWTATWDELRDFLSLHFWSNTRLNTPYWQHCQNDTDISSVRPLLDFYTENGPTGFARKLLNNSGSQFGVEGFLVMLVGNRVPYKNRHTPTDAESRLVATGRARFQAEAQRGLDVKESLAYVKHPNWRWFGDPA